MTRVSTIANNGSDDEGAEVSLGSKRDRLSAVDTSGVCAILDQKRLRPDGKQPVEEGEEVGEVVERLLLERQLVDYPLPAMMRLWPVFAARNPDTWARILIGLGPESCFRLTKKWDQCASLSGLSGVEGAVDKALLDSFFASIFDPCGSSVTAQVL